MLALGSAWLIAVIADAWKRVAEPGRREAKPKRVGRAGWVQEAPHGAGPDLVDMD